MQPLIAGCGQEGSESALLSDVIAQQIGDMKALFAKGDGKGLIRRISALRRSNGPGPGNVGFYVGANILVSASPAVEGADNVVTGTNGIGILQQHRTDSCSYAYPDDTLACTAGYHQATDEFVHDNTVTETGGGEVAGLDEDFGSAAPFALAANNRFVDNTYHLPSLAGAFFAWDDDDLAAAQWVAAGQDTNGTFSSP
jgi:hypothetical protein